MNYIIEKIDKFRVLFNLLGTTNSKLKERFPNTPKLAVALAYDVRQFEDQRQNYNPTLPNPVLHLSSKRFAQYAACVYAANGIHAHILPDNSARYLATPELSFAIRFLHAHGGLNISASHNPPDDNGGKFYDERGGQPVPPDDQIMVDLVEQVTTIKELPWAEAIRGGKVHFLDDVPHKAYIDLCRKQSLVKPPRFDEIQIVFTPLHGVGGMEHTLDLAHRHFEVAQAADRLGCRDLMAPVVPVAAGVVHLGWFEQADVVVVAQGLDREITRARELADRQQSRHGWESAPSGGFAASSPCPPAVSCG